MNGGMTKGVRILLYSIVGLFFLQLSVDRLFPVPGQPFGLFTGLFALRGSDVEAGMLWQLGTYMFLHSDSMMFHVIGNSLGIYFLGPETERMMGTRKFLLMYFMAGFLGGLFHVLTMPASTSCVGASGGLAGIVLAFTALAPERRVSFILLPMFVFPIWKFVAFYALIETALWLSPAGAFIAHGVHFMGALTGLLFVVLIYKPWWCRDSKFYPAFLKKDFTGKIKPAGLSDTQLDEILDKISSEGMGALSKKERDLLQRSSKKK